MLTRAVSGTAFRQDAFQPFVETMDTARKMPPLAPGDFDDAPLSAWLDSHLVHVSRRWVSSVSVTAPEPQRLEERLKSWGPEVELVDLQSASLTLIRNIVMVRSPPSRSPPC